ncbi:uncharacterized protein LOC143861404 [Tasmannia lanceolata]|uniref:uncharacterized protein LOC143861404 n=1 Tax=Tasmannia lanceolata TaxID=3420 RepID=UPI0040638FC1
MEEKKLLAKMSAAQSLPELEIEGGGKPLLLYLSITDTAMGCMLAQKDLSSISLGYPTLSVIEQGSFTFTDRSVKSIKGRVIAEQLADSPTEENIFLKSEFPDEEIMDIEEETLSTKLLMYFDGAFECTNNMAEYEACIAGLEAALALQIQVIDVFGDSMLIICQINGQNHFADALATLASMLDISATMEVQPLAVRLQWAPAHVNAIEISARCPDGKPWFVDIKNLISGKGHPPEASSKEKDSSEISYQLHHLW